MLNTWARLLAATRILYDIDVTPLYQVINSGDSVTFNVTANQGVNLSGIKPQVNWVRDNTGNVTGLGSTGDGYDIPTAFPLTVGPLINVTGVDQTVSFGWQSSYFLNNAQTVFQTTPFKNVRVRVKTA